MEKGGVITFIIVIICVAWIFNKSNNYTGQTVINTPIATEQPKQAPSNNDAIATAIAAVKPIATGQVKDKKGNVIGTKVTAEDIDRANEAKIAIAAPLVFDAIRECTKPIPPEQLTSHWGNETSFSPGLPAEKAPVSKAGAGATTPLQLMPATIKQFVKPGEDPETLAVSLKIAARHLCFARDKNNNVLDPASDAAILRYNASTAYLNSIRAMQAKHKPLWDNIRSGNGPMVATLANTAAPISANVTHAVDGPPRTHLFTANPIRGFAKWFSAYANHRADGDRVYPHAGIDTGCNERGEPVLSVCNGKVEFSADLPDGRGGLTVIVACNDGAHKTSAMHLDQLTTPKGAIVTAGQQIGTCGTTGNAERGRSGPHVHFKLERLVAGAWTIVSPCAGMPNETVLNCGSMWNKDTFFAPLSTVVASN